VTVPPLPAPSRRASRLLLVAAGLLQAAAMLAPAARAPLAGSIPFRGVEPAGALLLVLALLNLVVALRPAGWWRWLPGALTAVLLALMYWRIVTAPSGTFIDPLLRRAVEPGWGFVPMGAAALLSLLGAARARHAAASPPAP